MKNNLWLFITGTVIYIKTFLFHKFSIGKAANHIEECTIFLHLLNAYDKQIFIVNCAIISNRLRNVTIAIFCNSIFRCDFTDRRNRHLDNCVFIAGHIEIVIMVSHTMYSIGNRNRCFSIKCVEAGGSNIFNYKNI